VTEVSFDVLSFTLSHSAAVSRQRSLYIPTDR